jgi:uncharacterized repeat protein (TIGR01451 family)
MLAGDMAEIRGVVLNDLQGDGNPANDVPVQNLTVNLYRDGGDGVFNRGGGDDTLAMPARTTDSNGRYSFAGVPAGTYFVNIAPLTGQQTIPGGDVRKVVVAANEAEGAIGHTIDDFGTMQQAIAKPPLPSSSPSLQLDSNVMGGQRDMFVQLTEGTDPFSEVSLTSGLGLLRLASDTTVTGNARVIWDGVDDDAAAVNPIGLGGLDLSTYQGANMTGISLTVGADHPSTTVKLKVYTDANNWSEYTTTVPQTPGGAATKNVVFQFADQPTSTSGSGVDITNVGAIELTFEGVSAVDGQVSIINLVGLTPKEANFTVFDRMSIGNHVWLDLINDGRHQNEPGIAGVTVNLFADTDNNGQYTPAVDALLASVATGSNGDYLFADLLPGKYIVQIDPSNFGSGGPLNGLRSSTGGGVATDPDDDVNGDDNGEPMSGQGVISQAVTLVARTEPTNDGDNNPNSNLTVDFGFFGFDLVIDKDIVEEAAVPGEQLHFAITVTNHGATTAENVVLIDQLPPEVSFVSGTTSLGAPISADANGRIQVSLGNMAAGSAVTINIVTDVRQNPTTDKVKNIAEVSTTSDELDTSNNMDMDMVPLVPEIDLAVTKIDSRDPVNPGETFSYTITATNNGPSNATGVEVADLLPPHVTFVSATPVQSRIMDGKVIFDVGNMAAGATRTFTVTVRVNEDFFGTLLNEVWIEGNETETRTDNNHDEEPTVIPEPIIDLEVTKVDSRDPVNPGETFSYTITARNHGPFKATGVEVSDLLPANVTFVSATPVESRITDGKLIFDIGEMAAGATRTFTVTVRVDEDFFGTLLNEVWIEGNERETRTDNNHDEEPTIIPEPMIDLAITKVDSRDPVEPGGVFSYVIEAINNGPSDATGVIVSDELPDDVSFQSATLPHTVVDGKIMFNVGDLAQGETWSVTINVQVETTFTGTLVNDVWIDGDQRETRTDNNHDEETTLVQVDPTSISGAVFIDRNDNGRMEAGEQRIGGVSIQLTGTDFRGNSVNLSTTTNSNGYYTFSNLMPGIYNVRQTQPEAFLGRVLRDGRDELGENGDGVRTNQDGVPGLDLNADDDIDADSFANIHLTAGNDGTGYNFGELAVTVSKRDHIHTAVWNM